MELTLDFLAVFQPIELLVGTNDYILLDLIFNSLLDGVLECSDINLFSRKQLSECLLLLETISDEFTIGIPLLHALDKVLLVLTTTLSYLVKDGCAETVSLLNHIGRVCHLLLVSSAFFFAFGLVFGTHLLLFIVSTLSTISISIFAADLDQSLALEVIQEADDSRVDVADWLGKDAFFGLFLLFVLFNDWGTLGSLLGIGLRRGLALTAALNLGNLFHVLFAYTLTFHLHDLLFLFTELFACGDLL